MIKHITKVILNKLGYSLYSICILEKFLNAHRFNGMVSDAHNIIERSANGGRNKYTIFDVGANSGQSCFTFNHQIENSHIYAFEPFPDAYNALIENTSDLVASESVSCFNYGLGDYETDISVYKRENSLWNSLNNRVDSNHSNQGSVLVYVTTLDGFVKKYQIDYIDLLKIDVEGYELEVLKGSEDLLKLKKVSTIIVEVGFIHEDKQHTYFTDVNEYLNAIGYFLYGFYDQAIFPFQKYSQLGYCNALYVAF